MLAAIGIFAAPVAYAELRIEGLDSELEANLRALSPLATTACDSARWRVERLYREADQNMRQSLRALGYYDSVIDKSLRWGDDCWLATFRIKAGEPVRYGDISLVVDGPAHDDADFLSRFAARRPQPGDVLHHGRYEDLKNAMIRSATYTGYFDADFERAEIRVDRARRNADLDMLFASGEKYQFGDISFTPGILREPLLRRFTDIRPGQPYSGRRINELYEALNGSSYFNGVSIITEPLDEDAKTVPVRVNLTAAKRRIYSFGGGFTTDFGPHLRAGYTDRRRNLSGHQVESRLYVSPVDSELNGAYRWPKQDPRSDWFSIVGGVQHVETDTSERDKLTLGVQRTKNIGRSWLETRYINFERESFVVAEQDTVSQLIIVGSNWEKSRGRALSRARNGYRLSFDVRGASDSLGSDTSFLQLRTSYRWIHSFGDRTRILARASLATTAKEKLAELPASVRFFSGGDRSVRGYEYQSLGPVDSDGEVIGGSHQADLSLEIDWLMSERWAIAAFVDSGSAFNETDVDFSTGVGLGLRWYSPVGPIRLDLAHPLDDPDRSVRVHISLGSEL